MYCKNLNKGMKFFLHFSLQLKNNVLLFKYAIHLSVLIVRYNNVFCI